jgi:hypothetical protein
MAKLQRNFIKGKMNKSLDERLVPNGEYIDALNVRIGSTELSEIGAVENAKGNDVLTTLGLVEKDSVGLLTSYPLSPSAKCIGAYQDNANETIYWFVTDPAHTGPQATNRLDLVVSYNTNNSSVTYHVISVDDGGGVNTTLNFNSAFLITGVDKIDDLLFFTDNLNQPRVINVTTDYQNPGFVGGLPINPYYDWKAQPAILAEALLVIKKPPINSPTYALTDRGLSQNFLEDRFICFAYRYRYEDDMYSATSQFADPAFIPKSFSYDTSSFLNEGMVNLFDTAVVTFNTGGPLVVGVDLLFKEASNPVIRIIEKLDKSELGYGDYQDETYEFSNNKIYSLLGDDEILRLYDNVPLKAKAQTVMGKRLMYGNYTEGYDVSDVRLEYGVTYESKEVYQTPITPTFTSGDYTIGPAKTQANSIFNFDLDGFDLKAGSRLDFFITLQHGSFNATPPAVVPGGVSDTSSVNVSFSYTLISDFADAYSLSVSSDFNAKIGTDATIQLVYNPGGEVSCDGLTFTDRFNCRIPTYQTQGTTGNIYTKIASGETAEGQSMRVKSSATSSIIGFQLPAMVYDLTPAVPIAKFYEYYTIDSGNVVFVSDSNTSSLHSDRDYEVGIMYMDEYSRSTTVLVSPNNITHIPCVDSVYKNIIKVSIPTQQLPPSWATRYKFAIKQNKELYETIYSNLYFFDNKEDFNYFLLEGENGQKVTEGDRLTVKRDGAGPKANCTTVTVLEKKAQEKGFIAVIDPFTGIEYDVPAGVYMKIRNTNIVIDTSALLYHDLGNKTSSLNYTWSPLAPYYSNNPYPIAGGNGFPVLKMRGFTRELWNNTPINPLIPRGTTIRFRIYMYWNNWDGYKKYTLEKEFFTSQEHTDIIDWWNTDNIQTCLNTGNYEEHCPVNFMGWTPCVGLPLNRFQYIPTTGTSIDEAIYGSSHFGYNLAVWDIDNNQHTLCRWLNTGGDISFCIKGNNPLATGVEPYIECRFEILKPGSLIIFETDSQDAAPDIFYEASVSHEITGKTALNPNGFHTGNVQTQTALLPAIIDTEFQNCFTFGNGAESYKIRDSITRNTFGLGNRVSAVLKGEEYEEVHRFADITYSGVYGYNVNNLNEFNLGLLNFKVLEPSFGVIQKLFARTTDVLTLQEDKISYVLAGKNLLSDAAAGGVITSVPEVLGTQIARIEEYGIGNNPESFAQYGYDKYFTDSRRGVVIQLKGSAYSNEQLNVISDFGMSSWFRDLFLDYPNTQKLGGFDPYMKEYVLSSNDTLLPVVEEEVEGGIKKTFLVMQALPTSYTVDLGEYVGDCTLTYNVESITGASPEFRLAVTYDTVAYPTPATYEPLTSVGTGSFTFPKDKVQPQTATVSITYFRGGSDAKLEVDVTLGIPDADTLNIIQVCISDNNDKAQTIHNEYRWTSGTFVSPLHSNFVSLAEGATTPLISEYETITGFQGAGVIPVDAASVEFISNKYQSDNFDFDVSLNNFAHLRSATLYNNTPADIATLLGLATPVAGVGSGGVFSGSFTMLAGSTNDYLYLIYDYRKATGLTLCYSNTSADDACCTCGTFGTKYLDGPTLQTALAVYTTAALSAKEPDGWYAVGGINRKQVSGLLTSVSDCAACKLACGTTLSMDTDPGYYTVEVELGAATGAVVIDIDFKFIPDGVKVVYDGTTYNNIYSPFFGFINSPGTHPVYAGATVFDCGISGATFSGLTEYRFNGSGFNATGATQNVTVDPTSVFLQASGLGTCKMIIPKTAATPSTATITIISPCAKSDIDITVACPVALSVFTTTRAAPEATNIAGLCAASVDAPFYHVLVNGTAGNPAVGDIMFQDIYGSLPASAGFYAVTAYITIPTSVAVIEVDANGIIINSIVACIP